MTGNDYNNKKLVELRENKNLTQQNVADSLKVSRFTVLRAEKGESASWKLLQSFAAYYEVSISDLLTQEKVSA